MVAFQTDGGNRLFNKSCWYNWPQPSKIDWGADPKCEKQNYITFQRNSNIMIPLTFLFSFFFFFFLVRVCFLGPHLWHMEVSMLGAESELQLPAYTIATAMPDPSHICNLHHSSRQRQLLNLLSKARYRTHILMDTSRVHYH